MGSKAPMTGRCGAKLRDGRTYCTRRPVVASERCTIHENSMRRTTHGLQNKRLARLGKEGQARVAHLVADDELLDARRPVALAEYLLEQSLVEITDEAVDQIARRLGKLDDSEEPDDGLRAAARAQLLREPQKLLRMLSRLQGEALKQDRQKAVLVGFVAPHLDRLGKAMGDLAQEFIPDIAQREKFLHAVRVRLRAGMGEAVAALDDLEK